jgi:hypothetical protein
MAANPEHNFDRRESDANYQSLSVRVGILEERVHDIDRRVADNTLELQANTLLTKQVHKNTEDIVDAVKWMNTTKKLGIAAVAGIGGLAGAAVAVQAAGKSFGWW